LVYLYAPDRIETRFRYFETFTLPSLQAQTDPDFTLVMVIGTAMPRHYRDRLMDLLAGLPQAKVQRRAPEQQRHAMQKAIRKVIEPRGLPTLQFRMDDDDAVNIRFVERLRTAAADCAGLIQNHPYVAIDFINGHQADLDTGKIRAAPLQRRLLGVALATSVQPEARRTTMNFRHDHLDQHMPVVSYPEPDMYVRGLSDFNDSRLKLGRPRPPLKTLDPLDAALFKAAYNIYEPPPPGAPGAR
jgi:hypothetical protein